MRRKAIAEARQQKTMLAYSDEGDAATTTTKQKMEEKKRTPKTNVMMMMMMMMMKETRMMTPKIPTAEDKNVNTKNAKSLKAGAEEETKHLSAVNSLIMAHLQELTLGALFVATRMCFSNEESFGFTFARDISTLASTESCHTCG